MTLPRLVIDGNRLAIRPGGPPVVLRGMNISGLQHRRPAAGEGWLDAAAIDADLVPWIADQGATIVRVGTAIFGIIVLGESRDAARLVSLLLIVAGIIGLKLTSRA